MPPGTGKPSGIFSFICNKGTKVSIGVICILFILLGIAHILFLIVQQYLCKNLFLCSFWKLWYKKLCYYYTKIINVYTNLLWCIFFFTFFSGLIFNLIREYDSNWASDRGPLFYFLHNQGKYLFWNVLLPHFLSVINCKYVGQ